jgi:ankyrin repeat protein
MRRTTLFSLGFVLLAAVIVRAATADVADAAMRGDREAVRAAIARKADVNVPQVDGTTALHWAAERDDLDLADLLINAAHARRRGLARA